MHQVASNEAPSGAIIEGPGPPTAGDLADAHRAWLERLPESLRTVTAPWMHRAARSGATTSDAVLFGYGLIVGEHLARCWNTAAEQARLRPLVVAVQGHLVGARACAAWVLAWEHPPAAEQHRRKAERGRPHQQEAMAAGSPSERQVAYLRLLGYAAPAPTTMVEASHLIDTWKGD
jgi:hypothetical protein